MTNITIDLEAGSISGYFKAEVKNRKGEVVRSTGEVKNIITNYGLAAMFANTLSMSNITAYCAVGTSASTPLATNVNLGAQVARTLTSSIGTNENIGSPTYTHRFARTYVFAEGEVVANIAEVGLFLGEGTTPTCVTRALVKDSMGNPTTLTVLADETLYVTYELRFVPTTTTTNSTLTISGVGYSISTKAKGYDSINTPLTASWHTPSLGCWETNVFPPLGESPAGDYHPGVSVPAAHVPGAANRSATLTFTPSEANLPTGIGMVVFGSEGGSNPSYFGYYTKFNTKVMKTNIQTFTFTYRVTYSRG